MMDVTDIDVFVRQRVRRWLTLFFWSDNDSGCHEAETCIGGDDKIRGSKGVEENGISRFTVTVSLDENDTDVFPPPPVEDGPFLVNANSASLSDDYNNGSNIYIVDGFGNVVVDNGDKFGKNGATVTTNIAIPPPPPPLTEHEWEDTRVGR